jgi:hypothetical protein
MPFFTKTNDAESPSFKDEHSHEKRLAEAQKIFQKYGGDRIPIIIERAESSKKTVPLIAKKKYLVPKNLNFGQFIHIIRKNIKLAPTQTIFLFVNNVLPAASMTMGQLYEQHKSSDLFLYAVYAAESSFGH